jgi:S-methylmethionine-dependent homocysteine/selenocysteine methylase
VAEITILDGGMSREIEAQGGPLRQPEWSAAALWEAPGAVRAAHAAFAAAGAQVVTTNSYALVPFHIGEARFAAEARALAARSATLAREGAGAARVAGGLPPPLGSYRPEAFDAGAARRILAPLVWGMAGAVDLWLVETASSLAEARVAAEAVEGTGLPLWLAFTLIDAPEAPPRLRSGEPVAEAVALARAVGAEAVLFNCSMAEAMAPALRAARPGAGGLRLGVYANAFAAPRADAPANEGLSPLRGDLGPASYADAAEAWRDAGASIIGGCCGIGAAHIAALAARLTGSSRPRTP